MIPITLTPLKQRRTVKSCLSYSAQTIYIEIVVIGRHFAEILFNITEIVTIQQF